jgi:hypothetical protein
LRGPTREDADGLGAEHAAFWTLQRRRRELLDDDRVLVLFTVFLNAPLVAVIKVAPHAFAPS